METNYIAVSTADTGDAFQNEEFAESTKHRAIIGIGYTGSDAIAENWIDIYTGSNLHTIRKYNTVAAATPPQLKNDAAAATADVVPCWVFVPKNFRMMAIHGGAGIGTNNGFICIQTIDLADSVNPESKAVQGGCYMESDNIAAATAVVNYDFMDVRPMRDIKSAKVARYLSNCAYVGSTALGDSFLEVQVDGVKVTELQIGPSIGATEAVQLHDLQSVQKLVPADSEVSIVVTDAPATQVVQVMTDFRPLGAIRSNMLYPRRRLRPRRRTFTRRRTNFRRRNTYRRRY